MLDTHVLPDCPRAAGWGGLSPGFKWGLSPFRIFWGTPPAPRTPGGGRPSGKGKGTPPRLKK